jgi:hypothetical protein
MVAPSKEVYWLEKSIQNWLDAFSSQKNSFSAILNHNNNKNKLLALLLALVGGGVCYKIYDLIQPKKRRVPRDETEKTKQAPKISSRIDASFFSRLTYLMKIAIPGLASKEFLTIIGLFLLVICQSLITNWSNSISGDLMGHLVSRDVASYAQSVIGLTAVLSTNSFITPLVNYLMVCGGV